MSLLSASRLASENGPVDAVCIRLPVKDGKNGKPHVLTLQDLQDDSLQFDLSAEPLEELFIWYQAAWDITQREISKEYHRQHEVSTPGKPVQRYWFWVGAPA